MPLDPNIPLSVQPFRGPDPMAAFENVMRLQQQQLQAQSLAEERQQRAQEFAQTSQLNAFKLGELQRAQQTRDAAKGFASVFQSGDPDALTKALEGVDPEVAEQVLTYQKNWLDTQSQIHDISMQDLARRAKLVQAFKQPDGSYPDVAVQAAFELSHDQTPGAPRNPYADRLFSATQGDPATTKALVDRLAGYGQKPISVAAGGALVTPEGTPLYTAPQKPVSVAPGASLVAPDTGKVTYTAPAKPGTLQEQYFDALTKGDVQRQQQIKQVVQDLAVRDPAMEAARLSLLGVENQLRQQQLKNAQNPSAGVSPDAVTYWTGQIQRDPSQWNMLAGNKPLQQAVQSSLATAGVPLTKLTQQSRAQMETAREILPHITKIQQEAQELDQLGLMGPLAGKWRDIQANPQGAQRILASIAGPGPNSQKVGKFMTDVGLMMTAVARAHGGARGGGSPAMLEHMKGIMDAQGKDLPTFLGNLDSAREWMEGYATQGQPSATPAPGAAVPGPKANPFPTK